MKSKRAVANIGKAGSKSTKPVAFIPGDKRGTKLVHKAGFTHEGQPSGKSIGADGPGSRESGGYSRSGHMAEICGHSKGK